jgi:oligosaccharide repeat unit polymerase
MLYFIFNNNSNNKDFFHPKSFFLIFIAFEIPFALTVIQNHKVIPFYALKHIKDFDLVYFIHFFNSIIYITIVIISIVYFNPKSILLKKQLDISHFTRKRIIYTHIIFLFVGIITFYLFLESIGGLSYLLLNLDSKSAIIEGTGYYRAIYIVSAFLAVGFLIMYFSGINKLKLSNKIYLLMVIIIMFLILASTGSRKTPILFILYVLLIWNYNIKKIKLLTIRNFIFLIVGLFYFAAMPLFRTGGSSEFYLNNLDLLFFDSMNNLGMFFQRFSELERSLMIYSLFDYDNLWLGKSFQDILYSPIPRGLFPDKPPLDEGVYLYNIAHGNYVEPSTSLRKMTAVGWPPSTITNMYINFWYFGVILGGIIIGYFLKYFYNLAIQLNHNPLVIYFYTSAIFGDLAVTNRNIVAFLTMIVFSITILKLINFITRLKI